MSLVPPPLPVLVSDDPIRRLICVLLHDRDIRASASIGTRAGQDLLANAILGGNCRSIGGGVGLWRTPGCGICRAAATQVPRMRTAPDSNQIITISTTSIESLVIFLVLEGHRVPQSGVSMPLARRATPLVLAAAACASVLRHLGLGLPVANYLKCGGAALALMPDDLFLRHATRHQEGGALDVAQGTFNDDVRAFCTGHRLIVRRRFRRLFNSLCSASEAHQSWSTLLDVSGLKFCERVQYQRARSRER